MTLSQLTVTRFVAALGIVVFNLGQPVWPFTLVPEVVGVAALGGGVFFYAQRLCSCYCPKPRGRPAA